MSELKAEPAQNRRCPTLNPRSAPPPLAVIMQKFAPGAADVPTPGA
jgi:hypothetical protein